MKSLKTFAIAFFLIAAVASTAFINARLIKKVNDDSKGFAVVELFTSEGCSSCPPADDYIAQLQKDNKDKPVYILAFHVDYWDRLGWKDAFSSADFTQRQTDYKNYLHLQSIYTPQVVINGKRECVGSDKIVVHNVVRDDLTEAATAHLSLNISGIEKNKADIKYTIDGADKKDILLLAVVQKTATTKVERGENAGHTLSHVQIVRKLQKVSFKDNNGVASVLLPQGFDAQNWEVIGFLQNKTTGAISGAARATAIGLNAGGQPVAKSSM